MGRSGKNAAKAEIWMKIVECWKYATENARNKSDKKQSEQPNNLTMSWHNKNIILKENKATKAKWKWQLHGNGTGK